MCERACEREFVGVCGCACVSGYAYEYVREGVSTSVMVLVVTLAGPSALRDAWASRLTVAGSRPHLPLR